MNGCDAIGEHVTISIKARVEEGGRVTVDHLPLKPGQEVQLTIVSLESEAEIQSRYPLQGTSYRYEDPFGPAADPDEWEANR